MGNITIQGDLTGDVPGGEVGGASNLTTVGAIPYVSASGVLNQDPTALFWDAANDRLGVGTASPLSLLHVESTGGALARFAYNSTYYLAVNENSIDVYGGNQLAFKLAGSEKARIAATTGNLLIGTTTDSNFKLDVAASGSAGTMRVYDATATTGTTRMVVRAGAGQSGNLQEWQAANGGVRASVGSVGDFIGSSYDNGGTWEAGSSLNRLSNTYRVQWSSTGSYAGAADLSLSRASAGVLQVGDGAANANGFVSASRFSFPSGSYISEPSGNMTISPGNGTVTTAWNTIFNILGNSGAVAISLNGNAGQPFTIDVAKSGSSGTFRVYDQTATTGVTRAVIRAGAGQSTTNLTEWQNASATVLSGVASNGSFFVQNFNGLFNAGGSAGFYVGSNSFAIRTNTTDDRLVVQSTGIVSFGGSTSSFPALKRSSASLEVKLADDSAFTELALLRSRHNGVTVADLPTAAAGNAGSIQYVTDANATTIGSTVAGGGANKVMVWSDGAAWKIFAS